MTNPRIYPRKITTTAEPCSSYDLHPIPWVWSVYQEPASLVYRTPSKDTAMALAAELGQGFFAYRINPQDFQ